MTAEESAEMALTTRRVQMRCNGYDTVPPFGKRVLLPKWSEKIGASEDEIAGWERDHPDWSNTGILTARTPAIDIDIRHPEAADRIDELVSDKFADHGSSSGASARRPSA